MKTFLRCLRLFAAIVTLGGCACHTDHCPNGLVAIHLSHFDSADLSKIIVRRYDSTGFYTAVIDSFIDSGTPVTGYARADTELTGSVPTGDLELVFPYSGKTVRIYMQQYDDQTIKRCNGFFDKQAECYSPLKSYLQDGTYHTVDSANDFILITK